MRLSTHSRNIIYHFSGDIGARVLGFLATIYLARILGTSGFGIIHIGLAILSYAMILSDGGLQFLGVREAAGSSKSLSEFTGQLFITRFILSFMTFLLGASIVYASLNSQELKEVSIVYLLYIIPGAFLLDWYFQGRKQIGFMAIGKFLGNLSYVIFILLFVHEYSDILNVAWGWAFGIFVNTLVLWGIFIRQRYRIKFRWKAQKFIMLFKAALPLGVATIISQVIIQFPAIYIGLVSTTSEVGLFSAAFKLIALLLIFDRAFYAIIYPIISYHYQKSPEKLPVVFSNVLRITVTLALFVGLIATLSANFLIDLLFGAAFQKSILIFQIMIGYFIFTLIASVFGYTLIAMKLEKDFTKSLIEAMLVFFAMVFWSVKLWGAVGAAISIVIYVFTSLLIMAIMLKQHIPIKLIRSVILPSLGTFLIFVPILMFLNLTLLLKLFIATVIFLPLIALLSGVSIKEINYLKRALIWN